MEAAKPFLLGDWRESAHVQQPFGVTSSKTWRHELVLLNLEGMAGYNGNSSHFLGPGLGAS